jgi:hypothetical protein
MLGTAAGNGPDHVMAGELTLDGAAACQRHDPCQENAAAYYGMLLQSVAAHGLWVSCARPCRLRWRE